MICLRAVSILLLGLPLVCQVEAQSRAQVEAESREKVFVVNEAGWPDIGLYCDGLYAKEGEGSNMQFKRMGEADKNGKYYYLYRGTEQAGTWVLGSGTSFEERFAIFRASVGGGGDRLPSEGWQLDLPAST